MKTKFSLVCPACGNDVFKYTESINVAECSCGLIAYTTDLEIKEVDNG